MRQFLPRRAYSNASFQIGALLSLALAGLLLQGCTHLAAKDAANAAVNTAAMPTWHDQLAQWRGTSVLLLGEKHDVPEHQRWEQDSVAWLAQHQRLAALVIEMAEAGHSTSGLPATASAEQVRSALGWNEKLWPWQRYAGVVMSAVTAGAPVYGGNLPRAQMRQAMQDGRYDRHLPEAAWQRQREAIASGHCGLLPEAQLTPMARIQLARDEHMARTLQQLTEPGKTVLLIAGHGHVQRSLGVPTWLPPGLAQKQAIAQAGTPQAGIAQEADHIERTPEHIEGDPCAALRTQWRGKDKSSRNSLD